MEPYSLVGDLLVEDNKKTTGMRFDQPRTDLLRCNGWLNHLTHDCPHQFDTGLRALFDAGAQIGADVVDLPFAQLSWLPRRESIRMRRSLSLKRS